MALGILYLSHPWFDDEMFGRVLAATREASIFVYGSMTRSSRALNVKSGVVIACARGELVEGWNPAPEGWLVWARTRTKHRI